MEDLLTIGQVFQRDKRANQRKSERAGRTGDEDFHITSTMRGHPRRSLFCACYLCCEIALEMIGSACFVAEH